MKCFHFFVMTMGLVLSSLVTQGDCATIAARSPSQSDVQTAISSAAEGDTVMVPAGSVSWGSPVSIGGKAITVLGAGIDATVITSGQAFNIEGVEGKSFRVSGFTFKGSGGPTIRVVGTSKTFRLDNLKFDSLSGTGIGVDGYTYGVIDHCQFMGANVFNGMYVLENSSDGGVAAWKRPLTLGTAKAVYVEDCVFDFGTFANGIPSLDSRSGGRYVFRYNRVKNQSMGHHDAETQQQRGTFSWEVYGNRFEYTQPLWTSIFMRGGTGVIFNNVFSGTFSMGTPLYMTAYRSTAAGHGIPWNVACDGVVDYYCEDASANCSGSTGCQPGVRCVRMDGHLDPTGYPCIDQLGRTADMNGDGIQDAAPAYEWNNTDGSGKVFDWNIPSEVSIHLKEGRDYFKNVAMPGYAPLAYPHPLVGGGGGGGGNVTTPPSSPSNLQIQ